MKTIRRGTFETNSSSCHSITIVSEESFDSWEKGDSVLFYGKIIPFSESYVALKKQLKYYVEKFKKYAQESEKYKAEYEEDAAKMQSYVDLLDSVDAKTFITAFTDFVNNDAISKNEFEELFQWLRDSEGEVFSNASWFDYYGSDYETYTESQDVNGTKVVAFGYYGHD